MSEAKLTKQVRAHLARLKFENEKIYINKISDRYTSGIPDYVGVYNGVAFYIELKDDGQKPRPLQSWHLRQANRAGARVLSSSSFQEVKKFLESVASQGVDNSM